MKRLLIVFAALVALVPVGVLAQTPTTEHFQSTIAGNALDLLPDTNNGEVEVIAFGPIGQFGDIPVVVRNNTDEIVYGVSVKVEARDSDGKLIGVGETSPFMGTSPYQLEPGDIAIGGAHIQGGVAGEAQLSFVTSTADPDDFLGMLNTDTEIAEVSWLSDRIIGEVVNPTEKALSAVFLTVVCFDNTGAPLVWLEDAIPSGVEANGSTTFQISGFPGAIAQCEQFLIAGTGVKTS